MNITVTGRNIAVTDALRSHVIEKMESATSVFDIPMNAEVVLRVEKNPSNPVPQVVEVTIFVKGGVVRVSEAASDMYAAVDMAADRVARQLRKYKTRVVDRRQRAAATRDMLKQEAGEILAVEEPWVEPEPQPDEDEEQEEILREKLIEFTPLTIDQALLQTDLLGHDFFVFTDVATGDANVIYRRKNGGYGILKPVSPAPAMA